MPPSLSNLLEDLCLDIAQDFSDANQFARRLLYGEETITERLLLDLSREQRRISGLTLNVVSIAHVKKGKTSRSEPVTGADWEWHFTGAGQSFGVRVQAKKATRNPRPWGYADIASVPSITLPNGTVAAGPRQIDKLIADAKTHSCWPIYALYDMQFGSAPPTYLQCSPCPRIHSRFGGVMHADARALRGLVKQGQKLTRDLVRTISSPLPCIVDCPVGALLLDPLPARVRAAAMLMTLQPTDVVDDDEYGIPALSDGLPAHVNAILAGASELDEEPVYSAADGLLEADSAFENLAGVVVISEDLEAQRW